MNDILTCAIIGHLIGDYWLQNDWQSANKKKSSWICAWHCLLWTYAVVCFSGWFNIAAIAFLFVTHFAIDRTGFVVWWMKLKGQSAFASPPCAPWSIIIVDNIWHILTLWIVWKLL